MKYSLLIALAGTLLMVGCESVDEDATTVTTTTTEQTTVHQPTVTETRTVRQY